jgi:Ca2+-binding EF-hand superfamily protein
MEPEPYDAISPVEQSAGRISDAQSSLSAGMWDSLREDSVVRSAYSPATSAAFDQEINFSVDDVYSPSGAFCGADSYSYFEPAAVRSAPTNNDRAESPVHPEPAKRGAMRTEGDFKDRSEKLFDRIDTDQDGSLNSSELETAANDEKLVGDDHKAVELLQKYQSELEELSDDEFGDENDGITKTDLTEFGKAVDVHREALNMYSYGKQHFAELDGNGDGVLSTEELDQAIDSLSADSTQRENLEKMRDKFDDIKDARNDEWGFESGVTEADLLRYSSEGAAGWDETGLISDIWIELSKYNRGA